MSKEKEIPEIVDLEPIDDKDEPTIEASRARQAKKDEARDPLVGVRLKDTYELVKKVGEGGMGNVYSAKQYPLERVVAVKLLKPSESNPDGEHYFMREVQAINRLRHPNIIEILDYGKEPDGTLYMVMEFLPGRTLKRVIRKDFPLAPERILNITKQVLSALEQAHLGGIIHCDLKPANVMVEQVAGQADFVKVLDFGIAKIKGPAMEVGPYTQAGNIVGTFDYMSPEQIMRKDVDGRADVWSMGVIMYEMLTRKRIFHDKDAVSIIGRVMQMPIRRPSEILDRNKYTHGIPPVLEDLTLRAMERDIDKRFSSAAEMRDTVIRVLERLKHDPYAVRDSGVLDESGVHSSTYSGVSNSGMARDPISSSSGLASDTARTGLAPHSRSGMGDSQRMYTGMAGGSSVLDQTFSIAQLQESLQGERRKVAIVAIQQRARRKTGIDPETLARRASKEMTQVKEVVELFDGVIDSFMGGTFTLLFGSVKARVGDNMRAVECAFALQERFLRLEHGTDHLGIGVAYGEIFVSSRKGGNAFGVAVDRAVELARGVTGAQVFVDEVLVNITGKKVNYETPRNIGGDAACQVLGVIQGTESASSPKNVLDIFVARPSVMEDILRRAADVKAGSGWGLALIGEMGSGKSVMGEHLVAELRESGWLGFCAREERSNAQSLTGVRSWISQIAATYKEPGLLIRKACESMAVTEGVDGVVSLFTKELGDAPATAYPWRDAGGYAHFVSALLQRMVRFAIKQGPLILFLDDVNVQDKWTTKILDALLELIQSQPVLIAVTRQVPAQTTDHLLSGLFEVIRIGGFSTQEARNFIVQGLGYTPPKEVIDELSSKTNSNPMFLAEMVNTLRRNEGTGVISAAAAQAIVPLGLHELLAQRVDELPNHLRDVLAIASVLGDYFREHFFYQITPAHLNPEAALQELVALHFFDASQDEHGSVHVAFRPRALRQVIYDRIPRETRIQFHSRVIEFLETQRADAAVDPVEWPSMLSFHYINLEGWEGAAHYSMCVGDVLVDYYDYPGSIEQYKSAMLLLEEHGFDVGNATYATTVTRYLVALRESGQLDDAAACLEKLGDVEHLQDTYRAAILLEKGRVGMELTNIEAAYTALDEVREIALRQMDPKLEIQALLALAKLHERENSLAQAGNLLLEVSQKVEHLGELDLGNPDDRALYWTAYNQLGTLFIRQGELSKAKDFLATALRRAKEINDHRGLIRILSNLGALGLSMRDPVQSKEYFASALQFARGTGDLLNQSRILTNLGIALMESSDLEGSKRYFKQARTIAEEIGWHEGLADLSLHITKLKHALGG
jgi:serine/threonine protein kinase/tetratricopeptide (TPR) repeat protein